MNSKIILVFFLLFISVSTGYSFGYSVKDENAKCLRCHSMSTLGYKTTYNIVVNLSVNPSEFYSSNHKNLECINCHSKDFTSFPHTARLKDEKLYCLNCHEDNPKLSKYGFKNIEKEFKESIHYLKFGNNFNCFVCHDPHSFKVHARVGKQIRETVLYDNQICLQCHDNSTKIKQISGEFAPDLNMAHQWLPHRDMHWKSVRCIDCHTETTSNGVSHKILSKEKALKNCVACHSSNSILLQSLYKFQSKEERTKQGFVNGIILNNAYVIGATRNYYLNLLSFIIFGLTLIGIVIHWLFRVRAKKEANGKNE